MAAAAAPVVDGGGRRTGNLIAGAVGLEFGVAFFPPSVWVLGLFFFPLFFSVYVSGLWAVEPDFESCTGLVLVDWDGGLGSNDAYIGLDLG